MSKNSINFQEKYPGVCIRLIQRLQPPRDHKLANLFSFGGGYKNGGLSDDAMALLKNVFRFDYMGSAEFEFGEVPKAFQKIAKQASEKNLISYSFTMHGRKLEGSGWEGKYSKDKMDKVIYVITPKDFCEKDYSKREVELKWYNGHDLTKDVIILCASGFKQERTLNLKEMTYLERACFGTTEDNSTDVCGWLELDKGFMFFTDKEMYEKTCNLFGIAANFTHEK